MNKYNYQSCRRDKNGNFVNINCKIKYNLDKENADTVTNVINLPIIDNKYNKPIQQIEPLKPEPLPKKISFPPIKEPPTLDPTLPNKKKVPFITKEQIKPSIPSFPSPPINPPIQNPDKLPFTTKEQIKIDYKAIENLKKKVIINNEENSNNDNNVAAVVSSGIGAGIAGGIASQSSTIANLASGYAPLATTEIELGVLGAETGALASDIALGTETGIELAGIGETSALLGEGALAGAEIAGAVGAAEAAALPFDALTFGIAGLVAGGVAAGSVAIANALSHKEIIDKTPRTTQLTNSQIQDYIQKLKEKNGSQEAINLLENSLNGRKQLYSVYDGEKTQLVDKLNAKELNDAYKAYKNDKTIFKNANSNILSLKGINPDVINGDDLEIHQFFNQSLNQREKDNILTEYFKNNDRTDKRQLEMQKPVDGLKRPDNVPVATS